MKSKQHIPPWITKKIPHWAKHTKMDIDEKGKGRERDNGRRRVHEKVRYVYHTLIYISQ